jgi:hypothetical protein
VEIEVLVQKTFELWHLITNGLMSTAHPATAPKVGGW